MTSKLLFNHILLIILVTFEQLKFLHTAPSIMRKTKNISTVTWFRVLFLSRAVDWSLHHILPSRCKLFLCADAGKSAPPAGRLPGAGPEQRGVVQTGEGQRLPEGLEPATPAWHHSNGPQGGTTGASGGGWTDGSYVKKHKKDIHTGLLNATNWLEDLQFISSTISILLHLQHCFKGVRIVGSSREWRPNLWTTGQSWEIKAHK